MKPLMKNNFFDHISSKIDMGEMVAPVLFLWDNLEILHHELKNNIFELFASYNIPKTSLFTLEDSEEAIKIAPLRTFLAQSNMKSSFAFQIFLIENISRSTLESFNAALKFLEEPWMGNIVFLTAKNESGIPETILSRLQVHHISSAVNTQKNEFFYQLIDEYYHKKNLNLIKYFFADKKIEKKDYLDFFSTFIVYIQYHQVWLELIDSLAESMELIEKNNALPKYEVDKLFLKI